MAVSLGIPLRRLLLAMLPVIAVWASYSGVSAAPRVIQSPAGPTTRTFSSRGLSSERAASRHRIVIVLDPGHGGWDTGAVHHEPNGRIDLMEKTVTLEIALSAARVLRKQGYMVLLTRTTDRAVNEPPRDLNHDGVIDSVDELEARVLFANRNHASVYVAIHINGSVDPSAHGMLIYYCPAHRFWRLNLRFARLLDQSIYSDIAATGYRPPNYGVATDVSDRVPQRYADYPWFLQIGPADAKHGLVENKAVSALGETLFMTNNREESLLKKPAMIDAIAHGYAGGIEAFIRTDLHNKPFVRGTGAGNK
jgi:N-acetylmuramoyl-L-alanine amidase